MVGIPIDPPPTEVPAYAEKMDRTKVGGIAYRAWNRYSHANGGMLAVGTAYYMFLATLSLLAVAYAVTAAVGAERIAELLTDALNEAFPGLVGDSGIDPSQLRSTGLTAGFVGILLLFYSGTGAVDSVDKSMHLIYGAPPDPRPFVKKKARQALILLGLAPLAVLSFAATSVASNVFRPVLELLDVESGGALLAITAGGWVLGFVVDFFVLWLLLGIMGGIRPHRRPRLVASLVGAGAIWVVKQLLGWIVAWSLDKPQYGAFAAPLAVLFVLSLLATVLYVMAALTAGISDAEVPLEELEPTPENAVEKAPDPEA
jgi:membrane protein